MIKKLQYAQIVVHAYVREMIDDQQKQCVLLRKLFHVIIMLIPRLHYLANELAFVVVVFPCYQEWITLHQQINQISCSIMAKLGLFDICYPSSDRVKANSVNSSLSQHIYLSVRKTVHSMGSVYARFQVKIVQLVQAKDVVFGQLNDTVILGSVDSFMQSGP